MVESYAELSMRAAKEASPGRAQAEDHDNATGGAATITYAAVAGRQHAVSGVSWSFNGTPADGYLRIATGGRTVFYITITQGGAGFTRAKRRSKVGEALVITLGNTAQVRGDVNTDQYWLERS